MTMRRLSTKTLEPGDQRGFTLVELMVVIAIIAIIVAATAAPLLASVHGRVRITKAQADVRALALAGSLYSAHTGSPPANLDALTSAATNPQGAVSGPFIALVPKPPSGWGSDYGYTQGANGTFIISASGDNTTVAAP